MDVTLLALDKAISDCIMNITDFNPTTNTSIVGALRNYTRSSATLCDASDKAIIDQIAFTLTGSVAELTIKTLLSCFGDSDFMMRLRGLMVTPFSTAVPAKESMRKLGSEKITLYSYFQTEFPGFVRLYCVGTLSFDEKEDSIQFIPCKPFIQADWLFLGKSDGTNHGPATQWNDGGLGARCGYHEASSSKSVDMVPCIFCPFWPPEAHGFCERKRPHGWPTRSTIDEIVSLGCDFVQVSHPLYKNQNFKPQWRISFSRAEIILIRTWSNSQKIVYHLLRYLNKNSELFEDHVISTYHLKTLMLWNCERRPPEYWNSQQLMHVVVDMLSELKKCVQEKKLPSFFIPEYNLLFKRQCDGGNTADNTEQSPKVLSSFEVSDLIDWFLRNYLFVVAAKCPQNESGKMILDFQRTNSLINNKILVQIFTEVLLSDYVRTEERYKDLASATWMIFFMYKDFEQSQSSCRYALRMLQQADCRLINFFRAYFLLNVAQKLQESNQMPNHKLFGMILDLVTDFNDTDDCIWEYSKSKNSDDIAELYFSRSLLILKLLAHEKECDAYELLIELAKCCFKKSLECSDSSPISSAVVVYLSMISHKQKLYEEAIDLCILAIECPCVPSTYGINHGLLKAFDLPYLSAFIGFVDLVFHQRTVRNLTVKADAIEYVPKLIASMLLQDIYDCCDSSVSKTESLEEKLIDWYERNNNGKESQETLKLNERNAIHGYKNRIILNIIVMSAKQFNHFQRKSKQTIVIYSRRSVQYLPKISDDLLNSLLDLSTRYLTGFQRSVKDDLEPWRRSVITDQYLALNSFRSGDYATALELSDQLLESCLQNDMKPIVEHFIYHVIASPPFHLLLDDQLKTLITKSPIGLHFVDSRVLALYIKTECLLKLDKAVSHFCEPISLMHWYSKRQGRGAFSLSAQINSYQLNKLLRVLNGRLQLLPNGRILWSHKVSSTFLK